MHIFIHIDPRPVGYEIRFPAGHSGFPDPQKVRQDRQLGAELRRSIAAAGLREELCGDSGEVEEKIKHPQKQIEPVTIRASPPTVIFQLICLQGLDLQANTTAHSSEQPVNRSLRRGGGHASVSVCFSATPTRLVVHL